MGLIRSANLAFRFVLELGVLAATAYWGATGEARRAWRLLLAVVAPLTVSVVWVLFVAPRSVVHVEPWARFLVEVAVFLAAAVALLRRRRVVLASLLGVGFAVNRALMAAWDQ